MAIAFVAERQAAGVSLSGGGFSPAANTVAGNHLFMFFTQGNNAVVSGVTDTKGNTWDVVAAASSTGANIAICSCYLTAALLTSDTITISGVVDGGSSVQLEEFSGLLTSSWKDLSASNNGTGTSLSSGTTGTTAQADELVLSGYGFSGSPTSFTKDAAYTAFPSNVAGSLWLACQYQIVSSIGTQTAAGTAGASQNWWGAIATYKAAAAGGKTGAGILG